MSGFGWLIDGVQDEVLILIGNLLAKLEYGGVLHLSWFESDLQRDFLSADAKLKAALALKCEEQGVTHPIRLVWSDSLALNALAVVCEGYAGTRVVVMNVGSYAVLASFFERLLCSPTFLPRLGDVSLESSQGGVKFHREINGILADGPRRQPKCPVRREFAAIITSLALYFLFFHEVTHLFNGHLEMNAFIREVRSSTEIKENLASHTLEMDADSGAVVMLVNHLRTEILDQTSISLDESIFLPSLKPLVGCSPADIASIVSLAVTGIFILFGTTHLSETTVYEGTHPHSTIRQMWASGVLGAAIERHSSIKQDSVLVISENMLANVYRELDMSDADKEALLSTISFFKDRRFAEYLTRIQSCWSDDWYDVLNVRKITTAKLAPKHS